MSQITIEIEVDGFKEPLDAVVRYYHSPETADSFDGPGTDAEVELESIYINWEGNYLHILDRLTEEKLEEITQACFDKENDFDDGYGDYLYDQRRDAEAENAHNQLENAK